MFHSVGGVYPLPTAHTATAVRYRQTGGTHDGVFRGERQRFPLGKNFPEIGRPELASRRSSYTN